MDGLMMDTPLSLIHLFDRAERLFSDKTIVTATPAGRERLTYGAWAERTRRLGGVLDNLGISDDGRVATFAWNTARHLELYFAPPCSGRVAHTLNLRLFPDQLAYIVDHAEDEVIFLDHSVAGLIWPLMDKFSTVRHVVLMDDGAPAPDADAIRADVHDYEELLAAADPVEWTRVEENRAGSMMYTSGTTGNPKGVVYSHRSMVLHTFGAMMADTLGVCESDVILPVVPMFHANAWGLAHAAVATGATMIMPGANLSAPALVDLLESEKVTLAAGVPTIWMGVLAELEGRDVSSLRAIPCGGSAVPKTLSEGFREATGLPLLQAWGMTETSPLAAVCGIKSTMAHLDDDAKADIRTGVGLITPGVDFRIVDTETDTEQPWDGASRGELQVRGPWIARSYYNDERANQSFTDDGWLKTGDVATCDAEGYIRLVDRTKDLIKSGGEWISSVELENEIMAHPQVAEAAVIGVTSTKWGERAMACVVAAEGAELSSDDILTWLDGRVPKWWMPDRVEFIDEVPKTSVGKFSKKTLRERFADVVVD
ncbi:MAG: long-chain fatty acid--CoA ligase [Actinobacteria bacterium]|nr:long-chain fatty acid--CoA ligase [Actinomycetota bacterium]MBT6969792.1 long-chain fatty acid--CoA ligase [Actinomycetota bacterium]